MLKVIGGGVQGDGRGGGVEASAMFKSMGGGEERQQCSR